MKFRNAEKQARKAIEYLYRGTAVVTEYVKDTDKTTHLTSEKESILFFNIPCRLSFERLNAAEQTESSDDISLGTVLFVSPDVEIPPGSKVTVTQDGLTTDFKCSGVSAYYPTHQEITLVLWQMYA